MFVNSSFIMIHFAKHPFGKPRDKHPFITRE
jgi:hypothetical protein